MSCNEGLGRSFVFAMLIPALSAVLRADDLPGWKANFENGVGAFYAGRYQDAVRSLVAASEQAKELAENDRRRVQGKAVLALAYQFNNQTDRAENLFVDVKDALNPADPDERRMLIFALDGLSQIRYQQGKWKETEELLTAAIKLCGEEPLPRCRPTLLRHLGELYLTLDRNAEAAASLERAVAILRANPSCPEAALAATLLSLGSVYMAKGQFAAAQPLFEEALEVNKKLGENSQAMADNLLGLGRMHRLSKNAARAEPLLQRAIHIYEQFQDPIIVAALNEQGLILIAEKKFATARQTLERALAISKDVYGVRHIRTAYIQLAIAESYLGERDYSRAAEFMEPVLAMERETLPQGHVEIARALVIAAQIDQGRHLAKEADSHYKQALEIFGSAGNSTNTERKNAEESYARFAKGLRNN